MSCSKAGQLDLTQASTKLVLHRFSGHPRLSAAMRMEVFHEQEKSYRRYSPEFKREAKKRASEEGVTDAAVCKDLGVITRQFRRWRDELHVMGEDAFPGQE